MGVVHTHLASDLDWWPVTGSEQPELLDDWATWASKPNGNTEEHETSATQTTPPSVARCVVELDDASSSDVRVGIRLQHSSTGQNYVDFGPAGNVVEPTASECVVYREIDTTGISQYRRWIVRIGSASGEEESIHARVFEMEV